MIGVTTPVVPVDAFGDALLGGLAEAVFAVLPYAAAITAFAIGVRMIVRWIGAVPATRLGKYDDDYDDSYDADLVYRGERYDKYRYRHRAGGYLAHRDKGIGGPDGMRY